MIETPPDALRQVKAAPKGTEFALNLYFQAFTQENALALPDQHATWLDVSRADAVRLLQRIVRSKSPLKIRLVWDRSTLWIG